MKPVGQSVVKHAAEIQDVREAIQDRRPVCKCPKCGRQHRLLSEAPPPAAIRAGWIKPPDDVRQRIERELDEMMMGAENYFGAVNSKRAGHIRCALDRIILALSSDKGEKTK